MDIKELQHSLVLSSILNPNGLYGDIFLKEFIEIVIADGNFIYKNNEKWFINIEKERFDISIRKRDGSKIIIMENKSNCAEDQPNQLYRYWLKGIYQAQYRLKKRGIPVYSKIIYLSPSYEKQYTEQSITRPITSDINLPGKVQDGLIKTVFFKEEILKWLEKCMSLIDKSDMYFYIKQYADYWRNYMVNETLNQVEEVFSDKEQWLSFWKLAEKKEYIRDSWWKTFKSSVEKCFKNDNIVERWEFTSWDTCDFKWFLKEFGDKSLCLWLSEWNERYSLLLWADPDQYDKEKIEKLLEEERYSPIVSAFERQDEIPVNSNVHIAEKGNFYFGDEMDGNFGVTRLAWYAHYNVVPTLNLPF